MTLRIAHNAETMMAARHLGVSADRLAASMKRLSSGLRITTAADDAAGLSIAERMRSQVRGLEQASRNVQDGIALLNTIDGALDSVHSILQRARDLAVQWNNGTLGDSDRMAIAEEWTQLSAEVARIESGTTWNGIKLLESSSSTITLQVGANGGEVLSISLAELFGPGVGSLVRPNTFFALPWVQSDIQGFDIHITDVAAARSRIGSTINRLEIAYEANQQRIENLAAAESRIRDVDMAAEMANFTRQQLLQRVGSQMLLFANQSQQRILQLMPT